jgi:uncharacterized protein (DUF1778 family)
MTTTRENDGRKEQLHVRLSADEVGYIAEAASARGMTVSAFVRDTLLRRTGTRGRAERALSGEAADVVRRLGIIGALLRRSIECADANGMVAVVEIDICLGEVRAALAVFGA